MRAARLARLLPIALASSPSTSLSFSSRYPARRSTMSSSSPSSSGSITSAIRDKLQAALAPSKLELRNDSAKHAHHAAMVAQGGGSGETHFFVDIISEAFEGKAQLARHRQINTLLADEFERGLHALSIRARTPAEEAKAAAKGSS